MDLLGTLHQTFWSSFQEHKSNVISTGHQICEMNISEFLCSWHQRLWCQPFEWLEVTLKLEHADINYSTCQAWLWVGMVMQSGGKGIEISVSGLAIKWWLISLFLIYIREHRNRKFVSKFPDFVVIWVLSPAHFCSSHVT